MFLEMDKNWMRLDDRLGKDYVPYACGVRTFIDFARVSADSRGYIKCPCRGCKNLCAIGLDEVERHIFVNGMDLGYTRWVLHGEPLSLIHIFYITISCINYIFLPNKFSTYSF